MASKFLKWLIGDNKRPKKRRKQSLGLSYELQALLDLTKKVEDNEPRSEVLSREELLLKEVIKICDEAEDYKKIRVKDFKFDLDRIEKFLKTIKEHESRLKRINNEISDLDAVVRIKKKEISDAKQVAKYNKSIRNKKSKEIRIAKKKVVSELKEIKKRVQTLAGKPVTKVKKPKIRKKHVKKAPKPKKKPKSKKRKVKKEEPVVQVTTKVYVPEVEKSYAKKAKKISDDVVEEALSKGVKKDKKKKEKKEKIVHTPRVETEVDQILELVREKGKVSFSKLEKKFDESSKTIERWAEALEEQGFIEIIYPLIGSPYIRLKG
jgi:hypothetical protein